MFNNPFNSNPLYNPMGDYFKSQMQQIQQAPQFSLSNYQQQPVQQRFTINQVTSVEEARNQMIDPLVTSLFINPAEGKIYLKRMNNQGTSDFLTFNLEQMENKPDPFAEINSRLKSIEEKLGGKHESTTNVTVNGKSGADDAAAVHAADDAAKSTADE